MYEIRTRKDKRRVDQIFDVLPFGSLGYLNAPDAIGYAKHYSETHDAVIHFYEAAGKLIEVHGTKAISKNRKRTRHTSRYVERSVTLVRISSKKHARNSSHLAEAILNDSVRRHE
jgi:hypothetical protein